MMVLILQMLLFFGAEQPRCECADHEHLHATKMAVENLVITEIMQNPSAVSDSAGEWFEVFNPGTAAINLNGWTIKDNDADSHLITANVTVPAGGYLVLGRNDNQATNGGIVVAYEYSGISLANGADEVILLRPDAGVADEVWYDGGAQWPDPTGASMELTSASVENNLGANWVTATNILASGDRATPGSGPDGGAGGGNQAPTVSAGPNKTAFLEAVSVNVNLNGSASDPNNDPLTVQWNLVTGNAQAVTILSPNSAVTNVTFTALGSYNFQISADDGQLTTVDTVQVTITTRPANGAYTAYFGNVHSHSSYSDGNKGGNAAFDGAASAFRFARDQGGLDYLVVSDHNHATAGMAYADYHAGVQEADTVTAESPAFAAIYGTEWGTISTGGHVIYSAADLWGWEAGNFDVFVAKGDYDTLFAQIRTSGSFGQLCHPGSSHFENIFNGAYNASWDDAISLITVISGPAFSTATDYSNPSNGSYLGFYFNLLNKGYHLGPAGDQDSHYANWGLANEQRTSVLATDLSRPAVLEALAAGRTVATTDRNISVDFRAAHGGSEYFLAETVLVPTGQSVDFNVTISDADGESITTTELYSGRIGGTTVSSISSASGNSLTYNFAPNTVGQTDFFLVVATELDGQQAWSAPIWIEAQAPTANNLPLAGFSSLTNGLTVSFTDTSSDSDGTIATWSWNFGDGSVSSLANPSHAYAAGGTYTVSLTVTDNSGGSDSFSANVTVAGLNQPPAAAFSSQVTDLSVAFTDNSTDSDGTITGRSWNFGDGSSSTVQNPTHAYAAAGTYTVSLTVTDNDGASGTTSSPVTATAANLPPSASFSFSADDLNVNFSDTSSDSDGTIVVRAWNFGDGTSSSLQNPSHGYATGGTYAVSLTVTDNDGASDTFSINVTVTPNLPPSASFSVIITDLSAAFSDSSSDSDGSITSRSWNFGDGATSTAQNPSHSYASAGTYSVMLTVTDNDGASDSFSNNVNVTQPAGPETLIITEIMQNPSAVSDRRGEWFEVYNPGSATINLNGWVLRDDGSNYHLINANVLVPGGSFVVLGRNANSSQNGGISVSYQYSSFVLGNGADEVILERPDGSIADEVWYSGGGAWPDPKGASMALNGLTLDNNQASNWSTSTNTLPSGDKGTPGSGP